LPLLATAAPDSPGRLLLVLAVILVAAKLAGTLAEKLGQPPVLGELLTGVILGSSVLGWLPLSGTDGDIIFHFLAEIGVVLLLFEIGLETDLKEMFRVGPAALAVAAVGVAVPFVLGYWFWAYGPHGQVASTVPLTVAAIFVGATLTATSVGITARVLSDLGQMSSAEARIIVGAAVIDDVLGLVILGVVSALAGGGMVTTGGVVKILVIAVGFLVAAVVVGVRLAPYLFEASSKLRSREVVVVFAVAFCFLLAGLADQAGSALIIGAFAAGIVLSGTGQFHVIEDRIKPVVSVFTPIFFVMVGSSVDLRLLDPSRPGAGGVLWAAFAITLLAIVGKVLAGWAAPWSRFRRLVVGVGMIPRGEVGLIFADIGRRSGVLGAEVFNAVLLMVLVTTFIAPVLLKKVIGPAPAGPR
ncbi:MAG TPA: cation:proton antiporter, partial [Gemmatimonadales bacterium]|nr:cation:proton antiporter [Gemmatimonadales bacterium]